MSRQLLEKVIDEGVEDNLNAFFYNVSNYYTEMDEDLSDYDDDRFINFQAIGEIIFSTIEKMVVVTADVTGDLTERSGKKAQYEKARKILKSYMRYDTGIFVFSDTAGNFRLSLVYGTPDATRLVWSNFRRYTYYASPDQTNKTFLDRVGNCSFSSLEAIKDAFSVEKVNKEFYKEIASYYYRLTGKNGLRRELVLPSVAEDDGKKYEEYAVRLIGRIIFCWFLKHKKSAVGTSLISPEALSTSAVGNYPDYYHSILEPLFFEVMNRPVNGRKSVTVPQSDLIPFLNGGLFEPHVNDYYEGISNYALKIPDNWFDDFFSVLEQYNFTIDENSIVDADVSVDPDGETARKATGSYYTPRVIVDYLVEQSLKQYLLTKAALPEDKLDSLLSYEDNPIDLTDVERNVVVKTLTEIKVIDPACGSGAFPMGVLHRMLLVLEKVDPKLELWRTQYLKSLDGIVRQTVEKNISRENWVYIRKLMIIRDTIYGVDIQPIAVEISKLRCFLSLVVDETVIDKEENRGIEPLPNLEFKFVAANTLIGLREITDMGIMENRELIDDLATLRKEYFGDSGENKEQTKREFKAVQTKLGEHYRKLLITKKTDFTGATRKLETKEATQTQLLAEWDPFSYRESTWFDPKWMFGVEDGFDVVIANPPYVRVHKQDAAQKQILKQLYKSPHGDFDIYIVFIEKSLIILKPNGLLSFITSDKFLVREYGKGIRSIILNNRIIEFYDISRADDAFGAAVYPLISIIQKAPPVFSSRIRFAKSIKDLNFPRNEYMSDQNLWKESNIISLIEGADLNIIQKVSDGTTTLSNIIGRDDIFCGTPRARDYYKWTKGLVSTKTAHTPKVLVCSNLTPYHINHGKIVRTLGKRISNPYFNNSSGLISENRWSSFLHVPKILIRGNDTRITAVLDDQPSVFIGIYGIKLSGSTKRLAKFLVAALNSSLYQWIFLINNPSLKIGGNFFSINTPQILALPFREPSDKMLNQFNHAFDQIISAKQNNSDADISEFENTINRLMYTLYGLTEEEIAVVEGSVK